MDLIVRELIRQKCPFHAAVFDFDGTISMLRCGWESVMEKIMLEQLSSANINSNQLISMVRQYISDSTGIQTIYQMEWLAEQVNLLCGKNPLDPWEYKDIYNSELMKAINNRIKELELGGDKSKWLVPGSKEFLMHLKEAGIKLFIASGTDEEDVRKEADLLGISDLVDEVHGAPHRKKDCSKEAVIRKILENGNLTGKELLVVGDGKVEIELGRESGAVTIGIASLELNPGSGMNPKKFQKLYNAGADYILADFIPLNIQWTLIPEVNS